MRRRDLARRFGRNGVAVLALLDELRGMSAEDFRALEDNSDAILRPLFGSAAIKAVHAARSARLQVSQAAYKAAWNLSISIDGDPDYRGSRLAAEVAACLAFADLLEPARLDAVRDAFCAALGERTGCAAPFTMIRPQRLRSAA